MIALLLSAWRWVNPRVLMVLGIIVLALSLLLGARRAGRQAERVENLQKRIKGYESANKIRREVGSLSGADVDKRLHKYFRE